MSEPRYPRFAPGRALPALAAMIAVAGCEPVPVDFHQAYRVGVTPETVSLPAHYAGTRDPFAGDEEAGFNTLVAGYLDRGHGPLTVSAATSAPSDAAAHLADVRARLTAAGVPASAISVVLNGEGPADTVTLSYERYNVALPVCGDYSTNLSIDFYNVPPPNFGCAVQRNIGLMVADPGDLAGMRTITSTDAQNSERVMSQYRTGAPPAATETPLQQSGAVGIAAVGH